MSSYSKSIDVAVRSAKKTRTLELFLPEVEGGRALAEALSYLDDADNVQKVIVRSRDIGAFQLSLRHVPSLTSLDFGTNNIGDEGAASVAAALQHVPLLTSLDLGTNNIGDNGAVSVAAALQHVPKLTSLDLGTNRIGDEGAVSVAAALQHVPDLTSLSLRSNKIRRRGIAALCDALPHVPLVSLDLGSDSLRAASEDGDVALVELLLGTFAVSPWENLDYACNTAFHIACKRGHVDLVRFLAGLQCVPDDLQRANSSGMTPLALACFAGHRDVVHFLVTKLDLRLDAASLRWICARAPAIAVLLAEHEHFDWRTLSPSSFPGAVALQRQLLACRTTGFAPGLFAVLPREVRVRVAAVLMVARAAREKNAPTAAGRAIRAAPFEVLCKVFDAIATAYASDVHAHSLRFPEAGDGPNTVCSCCEAYVGGQDLHALCEVPRCGFALCRTCGVGVFPCRSDESASSTR